ncbi:hypothetical protein COV18_02625 [Candidatus Woesearchaeota archaeon CG10_big_fil_rev_8_21_14_0_10_37_12]|nr:MAG: hypothetical protein COV18_02625 [Candidatus Woesearchaeota archaeon CG10_big_fil_rev_8_21_14_0_10_37_12]
MFKTRFDIVHKGCWGSEISKEFPGLSFSAVDCHWTKGNVVHILKVSGDESQFNKVITYLKKRKEVISAEVLSKDDLLFMRVLTEGHKKRKQFSDMFFENGCFPVVPIRFEGGFEKWTLGTSKRKNLTTVYNELKKYHSISIKEITEGKITTALTQKQREAMMYANHFGYFDWPRKKTATEIAKLINVPKTVFLSHLRKAENKILKSFLEKE